MLCIKGNTLSRSPPSYNLKSVLRTAVECPFCKQKSRPYYLVSLEQEPSKVRNHDINSHISNFCKDNEHIWIYHGRNNGWWTFDQELQTNLEHYYIIDKGNIFKWVICGQSMEYDFSEMIQRNINNGSVRSIKRINTDELEQYVIKGMAGVK